MKKVSAIGVLIAVLITGSFVVMANATKNTDSKAYFKLEPNGYSITFPEPNEKQLRMIKKAGGGKHYIG